jgi:hypothetical protein
VVASVDVDLAAVDVAATVYTHCEQFRRRHLLAEARRHLARELRGRRAAPGLDNQIVDAAVGAHCVDITPPPMAGRRPRPPGHTACTAAWHPPLSARRDRFEPVEDAVPQLSVHARAVATSISLQALLRASRTPAGPVQPVRAARAGKPLPQDQATAAALYEQLTLPDRAGADDDGQEDQEQQLVLSPERPAWLEELQRRIGQLAREAPKAEPWKGRGGTAAAPPRLPAPPSLSASLSVVGRQVAELVVGDVQRLVDQAAQVSVAQRVDDAAAVLLGGDQSGQA